MQLNKKFFKFLPDILFFITILFIIIIFSIMSSKFYDNNLHFNTEKWVQLNNWEIKTAYGTFYDNSLNTNYKNDLNTPTIIKNTFPENNESIDTMLIRSSLSSIKIYVEDELIYEEGNHNNYPGKTLGSYWNVVKLKDEYYGKPFKIEFLSPYKNYNGYINEPILGSNVACLHYIVNENKFSIITNIMIISFGFQLIVIGLILIYFIKQPNIFYIGLFTLFSGFWLLGESRVLQFITSNSYIITRSTYYILPLVPVPLLLYLEKNIQSKEKKYSFVLIYSFIGFDILRFILEYNSLYDAFQTNNIFNLILLITFIYIVFILYKEAYKYKNSKIRHILPAFIVLIIFSIIETVIFILLNINDVSQYFRIGLILFLIVLLIYELKALIEIIKEKNQKKYYKRLALYDYMTNAYNRVKYEEDIQNIIYKKNLYIIQFDTDNLKYVNDKFGHSEGDKMIKATYECIANSYGKSGNIYRTGGDEFTCLIIDRDINYINICENKFKQLINKKNSDFKYNFSISYGYAKYDKNLDKSIVDTYDRADEIMYKNKATKKS